MQFLLHIRNNVLQSFGRRCSCRTITEHLCIPFDHSAQSLCIWCLVLISARYISHEPTGSKFQTPNAECERQDQGVREWFGESEIERDRERYRQRQRAMEMMMLYRTHSFRNASIGKFRSFGTFDECFETVETAWLFSLFGRLRFTWFVFVWLLGWFW